MEEFPKDVTPNPPESTLFLGGAGTWLECYEFSEADGDFAASGGLCDSAGRDGCPRERIANRTEIEICEFMDVPHFPQ